MPHSQSVCPVCGPSPHVTDRVPTADALWQGLAEALPAFQNATTRDELLRVAAAVLLELTGARRVDAELVPVDGPLPPPPEGPSDAAREAPVRGPHAPPLAVPLRARDGRDLGTLTLHPGDHPWSAATEALARTVAQGVALVLTQMDATERMQAEALRYERLLGTVAHVVREALDPVVHALPLLASAVSASPTVARAHGLLAAHAPRAAHLLDDLLDVRRAEAGQLPLQRVSCTLGAVVERAVAAVRPEAEARAVRVEVRGPSGDLLLMADLDRLVQGLGILLDNAVRVTPEGGVVSVRVSASAMRARVVVTDQESGMAATTLATLFTPQADGAVPGHPAASGVGVSLALARHLMQLHGGTLTAHSDGLGHGSTFTIDLPATPFPALAPFPSPLGRGTMAPLAPEGSACTGGASDPSSAAGPALRPLRILVVDDHHDAADALALLLAQDGHQVTVSYDGDEAVRQQRQEEHEVVLLDIGLPRTSGYEVARAIRRAEADAPALLVALTGWGQAPDRRRSFEAGFDHHLVKPVAYPALRSLLRHWTGAASEATVGGAL